MLKTVLAVSAFTLVFVDAAAQDGAAPPPVETMTCEQMVVELTGAGQTMTAQLDPEFATEAQAMHDEAQAGAGGGRQPNRSEAAAQVESNHARIRAQEQRLQASMAGLDQQRLMALAARFEDLGCETPQ